MSRLFLALSTISLLAACGGGAEECLDDRSCGAGNRCVLADVGEPGACAPCDAKETPYDGVDNDCNGATRDRDLDRDGDDAVANGGADCDDNDPDVSSKKLEICADGRDNDCDGSVDEIDCGDKKEPTVMFLRPAANATVSGTFEIAATIIDDVGVVRASLLINGVAVSQEDFSAPLPTAEEVTFTVDTLAEQVVDGVAVLRIVLTDVADKVGEGTRSVVVDNRSGPTIRLVRPNSSRGYGGRTTIEAVVEDVSGVASVSIVLGANTVTATMPPYAMVVDTTTMMDGTTTIAVSAVDLSGHVSSEEFEFEIDNHGPTVTFTEPLVGRTYTGIIPVSVVADDPSEVLRVASGGVATSTGVVLDYRLDTEQCQNPCEVVAFARDDALIDDGAGFSNTTTVSIFIDSNNVGRVPEVALMPANGDAVFGLTHIIVMANSPLPMVRISSAQILVDGTSLPVTGSNPYTADYDFLLHPSPTAVIDAIVTDSDGRIGQASSSVTLTQPPNFRIASQRTLINGFTGDGFDVGDVDGDDVVDVVAGGASAQVMTGILNANGDWIPSLPVRLDPMEASDRVRLIDTDGDGRLDLFSLDGSRVRLYLNNGTGFSAPADVDLLVPGPSQFVHLAVGDLDGDLDADVVLAGRTGQDFVVLLSANNTGFMQSLPYGLVANVTDLQLADADDDGDLDVVLGRSGTSALFTTYLNIGNGSFGAGQDSFTGAGAAQFVAIGDVTGDGYPDAVAVLPTVPGTPPRGQLAVLAGDQGTPGTFVLGLLSVALPPASREVLLRDLDGDGSLDAVVDAFQANSLQVLFNDGTGVFPPPTDRAEFVIGGRPTQPHLVDLDGDLDLDYIAIATATPQTLAFAENLGSGDFYAAPVITPNDVPRAIASGDVIGTTEPDFVLAFSRVMTTPAGVSIWSNSGGVMAAAANVPIGDAITTPTSIAIGDLDGAGLLDLTVGSNGTMGTMNGDEPAVAVLNQGSGTFDVLQLDVVKPTDTIIADVDNDGIGEALFTTDITPAGGDGANVWDLNGGVGSPIQVLNGSGARAVAAGDLGDEPQHYIDFVVANSVSNDLSVSLWDGISGWNTTAYNALPGIVDVTVGYVDNDPIADLIAVGTPGLIVMRGLAGGGFTGPVTAPAGPTPVRVFSGDFNDDGLTDAVVLNSANRVSVLIASPQGLFFEPLTIPVGDTPIDFTTADFDGDGLDDLAIACSGVGAVIMVYSAPP